MKNRDIPLIKSLIEKGEYYDLTVVDFEKIVAYKWEFIKFLQTYRLSLMIEKIDNRDADIEKSLGNQIDVLSLIMGQLNLKSEEILESIKSQEKKKIFEDIERKIR